MRLQGGRRRVQVVLAVATMGLVGAAPLAVAGAAPTDGASVSVRALDDLGREVSIRVLVLDGSGTQVSDTGWDGHVSGLAAHEPYHVLVQPAGIAGVWHDVLLGGTTDIATATPIVLAEGEDRALQVTVPRSGSRVPTITVGTSPARSVVGEPVDLVWRVRDEDGSPVGGGLFARGLAGTATAQARVVTLPASGEVRERHVFGQPGVSFLVPSSSSYGGDPDHRGQVVGPGAISHEVVTATGTRTSVSLESRQPVAAVCDQLGVHVRVTAEDGSVPDRGQVALRRNGEIVSVAEVDPRGEVWQRVPASCTEGTDSWTAQYYGTADRYATADRSAPVDVPVVRRTQRVELTVPEVRWGAPVSLDATVRSDVGNPVGTVVFSGPEGEISRVQVDQFARASTWVRGVEPGLHTYSAVVLGSELNHASTPVHVEAAVRPVRGTFHPIAPVRLRDSRVPFVPCFHVDGPCPTAGDPLAGGTQLGVPVVSQYYSQYVRSAGALPPEAAAVALNVTTTQPAGPGWLAVHAGDRAVPLASTANLWPGQDVANMVVAKVGHDGQVAVHSSERTHAVVDAVGYWTDGTSGARTAALTPARLLDTRRSFELMPEVDRVVPVRGRGGVPEDATAVVVNLTTTESKGLGFVAARAAGTPATGTSSTNLVPGEDRANLAIVEVGANGAIALRSSTRTHAVLDVVGYLSPTTGDPAGPLPPRRLLDTRDAGRNPVSDDVVVPVVGRAGVPAETKAVWVTLTTTEAADRGFLTAWPSGEQPLASNANVVPGQDVAALALVPLAADGTFRLHRSSATHVIVDVVGTVG